MSDSQISERLTWADLEVYAMISTGSVAVRESFTDLLNVLRNAIIPGILRFPFPESVEERDAFEEGLLRADSLLTSLSTQMRSIPRSIRKQFAAEIATSRTLNKWRRSSAT
jgi:hypothetical protein